MASRVMAASNEHLAKRAVAACVGMAAAERFFSYLKVFGRVPVEAIVKDGRAMDFTKGRDSEPSFVSAAVFALAGWLCQGADLGASGISHVAAFLRSPGLDPEYVFLFLRQLRRRPEVLARLRADAGYRRQAGELVDLRTAFLR